VKVLVVLPTLPLPEGGAPGRCAVALLRGLTAHGVEVQALAARQYYDGEPPSDLPVELVDVEPARWGWSTLPQRLRRPRGRLGQSALARRVRELAAEVDVVHLEETETAWCDQDVRTPSLVHIHYRMRRDRRFGAPWGGEFPFVLEGVLAEQAAIRRHRYLVCSSSLIAEALRTEARHADVVHAPLSLDPRYYEPATLDGAPIVGIIGTGSWRPTAEAMSRLVTRVWPLVRERFPEARLRIAGRALGWVPGLTDGAGVEILGEVPSSAAFLRNLSLLLFPLERGSGMKVKVLEALATGVPVVTTPAGAEGIDANGGIVLGQDDAELAAATVRLLRDADESKKRGLEGRQAFLRRYTPEPATKPVVALYERIAR
jgi:glycosyltransferase involved in cell wall biosynthesis